MEDFLEGESRVCLDEICGDSWCEGGEESSGEATKRALWCIGDDDDPNASGTTNECVSSIGTFPVLSRLVALELVMSG